MSRRNITIKTFAARRYVVKNVCSFYTKADYGKLAAISKLE